MNFKIRKLKIAAVAMCAVVAAAGFAYVDNHGYTTVMAKTISDLEDEKAANEAEIDKLQDEMDSIDDNIANKKYEQTVLQEKIDLQTENLNIINAKIDDIKIKISETEKKIGQLEVDIDNKKEDIDIGLEQFKDRLFAMYVSGNDSLASALVGATDFYDMLSKMEFISQVSKHDNELVNSLKTQLEQYEEAKIQLATEKENLDNDLADEKACKEEFNSIIAELNADYQKSQEYIDEQESMKSSMQADIDQYEKDNAAKDAEIEKINKIAEQQAKAAAKQATTQSSSNSSSSSSSSSSNSSSNNSYYEEEESSSGGTVTESISSSSGSGSYSGSLSWPVPGHYVISSGYGQRWGSLHAGVDISDGSTMGASIAAAESGTVVMVATGCSHNYGKDSSCGCNGGYGNYFMIDHGNGVTTFYAHCSDVYVSVGQQVSRGEIVATAGSTGWSTGAHLHFEVRINGSTVDPAGYLY
ncbi:MAG: murein hydrolase activator EnvC family protein [Porcipelethomonas sp.]